MKIYINWQFEYTKLCVQKISPRCIQLSGCGEEPGTHTKVYWTVIACHWKWSSQVASTDVAGRCLPSWLLPHLAYLTHCSVRQIHQFLGFVCRVWTKRCDDNKKTFWYAQKNIWGERPGQVDERGQNWRLIGDIRVMMRNLLVIESCIFTGEDVEQCIGVDLNFI